MISRTLLAVLIAVWTLISWGGRIRLLTDAEQGDLGNWLRIGGSLLVGAVAVAALLAWPHSGAERWLLTLFAGWTAAIWLRSLVTVWLGEQSLAFKVVHTGLAAGYLALAYLAVSVGWIGSD